MNHLVPAQAGAQLVTLVLFVTLARWYVVPWLAKRERADALIALLWVNVFRYVALNVFAAQRDGFPISNHGALEIVIGDVGGAIIAFTAIVYTVTDNTMHALCLWAAVWLVASG